MVAYSFMVRFADAVATGRKRQTVRANRKRHARPGERLQLYAGMRTKHCRKLVADPVCRSVEAIRIDVRQDGRLAIGITGPSGRERSLTSRDRQRFAEADGFASQADMHAFWAAAHGYGLFEGVLISW